MNIPMSDFDRESDRLHRIEVATSLSPEWIADSIMDRANFRDYQTASGSEVREWLAKAVQVARGEVEA